MKKSVLIVMMICLVVNASHIFAQQRPSEADRKARFEKFQADREAFISKAMKLTDDEKKAFWPLCNELQMKKFELNGPLRGEMRKINQALRSNKAVSEADYKKVLELSSRIKVQEAQLEQEYLTKFLHVVPAEKVFLYRQSEQDFGEKMMQNRSGRNQRTSDRAFKQSERAKLWAERVQNRTDKAKDRADKAQKKADQRHRGI
jgi:hypothetical protein